MACNDPYQNPAGLKFVTRVQYLSTDPQYTAAQDRAQLILNIPNGAGPGTLYLGTHDTYASWTVTDVRNLVRQTQRAYTGAASWEQLFVEDGCTVNVTLLDSASFDAYDDDGVRTSAAHQPRIFAQWFPAGTEITSFDRLSLVSGVPTTPQPFPFRTLNPGVTSIPFVPPGLCRFVSISSNHPSTVTIGCYSTNASSLYETLGPATNFTRAIPAWGVLDVTADPANATNFSVCWNRYPMIGA
jgi:hypothetical protein